MKYRIKKSGVLLILIIILIIYLLFNIFNNNKEQISKYKAIITDTSENNSDIVEEYFINGMSNDEYINSIEKIDNYLTFSGKYENINYDFEKHYHYDELEEIYKKLALSKIVKLELIGQSVDNRNLYSIEIGVGDKVTLFEAGIHGSEYANPLFITKFMVDIVNAYENGDENIINLLTNNKIVVLPSANPDGYEATLFGPSYLNNKDLFLANNLIDDAIKTNANGVDLNRNFPSQTSGLYYSKYNLHYTVSLEKSNQMYRYFPGDTLGSEPETRAIIYLQNKWLPNLKSYVALHSAGRLIYNGKPYLSDEFNNNSNSCASIIGDTTGYMVMSKFDEEAGMGNDGTSSEYMAETLSGFTFSSKTGRLSSVSYAEVEKELKYKDTCVIVIESLTKYTNDLDIIKNEYYDYNFYDAYINVINRK